MVAIVDVRPLLHVKTARLNPAPLLKTLVILHFPLIIATMLPIQKVQKNLPHPTIGCAPIPTLLKTLPIALHLHGVRTETYDH
jgi:hypothetical protein